MATLAAQFFLIWLFNRVAWFYNYNPSGTITAPPRTLLGIMVTGPEATAAVRYLMVLSFVVLFALIAKNLVRSEIGRTWMAIRDMDVAAEIIGIRPLTTKLSAFAISSFYCGVAGALMLFAYLGSVETLAFDITVSFEVLFMVIIGGLGSILGSIVGAAFITILPIFLTNAPPPRRSRNARRSRQGNGGHHLRRLHHRLPHPRTPRPRPPVADQQGKAAPLAVSVLITGQPSGSTSPASKLVSRRR